MEKNQNVISYMLIVMPKASSIQAARQDWKECRDITMLPDVSIRQLMIWQDFNYSGTQCQVETPDIM